MKRKKNTNVILIKTREQYVYATERYDLLGALLEDAIKDMDSNKIIKIKKEMNDLEKEIHKYERKYKKGGYIENENALMVANNNKQIAHHTKEMEEALKGANHVPAWVVSKVNRAASDLSDATHYLEGAEEMYADGGGVKGFLNKAKDLAKTGVSKTKSAIKEQKRKIALDVIDETRAKKLSTNNKLDKEYSRVLRIANELVENKYADGGGIEELTPVELYFRNLDYSKLPENFSNFIKTEILPDPELKYLSEREPIFIDIKEKVEKYQNQNAGKVEESEEESISDLIAGLEVLIPMSSKKEQKELNNLIEGLKLLI